MTIRTWYVMLTGRFARESIHPKLFRPYVSLFALLFLKPEKSPWKDVWINFFQWKLHTNYIKDRHDRCGTCRLYVQGCPCTLFKYLECHYRDRWIFLNKPCCRLLFAIGRIDLRPGETTLCESIFGRNEQPSWIHIKHNYYTERITVNNILKSGKFP